jgi:hypothetical protein
LDTLQSLKSNHETTLSSCVVTTAPGSNPEGEVSACPTYLNVRAPSLAPSVNKGEEALLERICTAYKRTVERTADQASEFHPTLFWKQVQSNHLRPVQEALLSSDFSALRAMYGNFFLDACGKGLVRRPPNRTNSDTGLGWNGEDFRLIHEETLSRIGCWRAMTGGRYPLTVLQDASVGNPFGTMMEGVFVPANSEYHHACADRILSLTGEDAKVVEIGGGYGHMAYYLLRDAPGVAYLDFDMPESLALAAYYLGRSHPERRMLLYGEESLSIHAMENYDILLMPPWEMGRLTRGCANLTFSSHVISDLTPQAREIYLQYIAFFTAGYVVDIGCDPGPEWSKAYEAMFARQFRLMGKHKLDWSAYRAPGASEWQRIHRTELRGSL